MSFRQFSICYAQVKHSLIYQLLKVRSNADMDMHEHRRHRLLCLIADHYGGDRKTFCDASDMSEARLAQLLSSSYRNGQGFGEKAARTLERKLALNDLYFDLLAVSETSARHAYQQCVRSNARMEDYFPVRQVALKLSPGSTSIQTKELPDPDHTLQFHASWLKARHFLPDKLLAIAVTDASMSPRLSNGDVVVIDTSDTALQDGMVYVVNYNGNMVIKRLALDFGRWFMTSDNPNRKHYQRQEFLAPTCVVIGRVVFAIGEHL